MLKLCSVNESRSCSEILRFANENLSVKIKRNGRNLDWRKRRDGVNAWDFSF